MDLEAAPSPRGRVLALIGASGGCGASSLAAACALQAADTGWSVALVDLADGGGGIDVVCGAEHLSGVRWPDLAECRGVVDGHGLLSRMPHAGPVALLAQCRDSPTRIPEPAVDGVLAGLAQAVDVVVLDLSRARTLRPSPDVDRPGPLPGAVVGWTEADLAIVVSGVGIVELAALAATTSRVAQEVPECYLVLRGRKVTAAVVEDVCDALDVPVLGVLDDDPTVGRDLARGRAPGRSAGALEAMARQIVRALAGRGAVAEAAS